MTWIKTGHAAIATSPTMSIVTGRVPLPSGPKISPKTKPRLLTGPLIVACLLLACDAASAQSISKWRSLDPRASVQPLNVTSGSGFRPGQYMIYVANSDPDGRIVSSWSSHGPLTLQPNDIWEAALMPSTQLRLEKVPATSGPSTGLATIRARNGDIAAWQSICVLPVGMDPRPDCFGGTMNVMDGGAPETYSQWASITPNRQQFGGQPGGALPLIVKNNPHFVAGSYMIYVANSDPHGATISRWNTFGPVTLQGRDKWVAVLMRNAQLRLEKNEAALLPYATPGPHHAMIYTRNDDLTSWQSICVLPVGMKVEQSCFGGSNNVAYVAQKPAPQAPTPTTQASPQPSTQAGDPSTAAPQSPAAGTSPAARHGGVFAGQVTIRRGDAKPGMPGTIELIVKDGKVSGSMAWPPETSRITASISGTVGPDMRMTAKVDGKSEWLGSKPGYSGPYDPAKAIQSNIDALRQFLSTYPFSGELTGRIEGNGWAGAYQVRSTDKRNNPVVLRGTWNAAPKK